MIEELEQRNNIDCNGLEYQDEKQFEYLVQIANEFCPQIEPDSCLDEATGKWKSRLVTHPSLAPNKFANRYFQSEIDVAFKDEYLKSQEVIETLTAFEIDVSKFWYLSLFIKDVVIDKCVNAIPSTQTPREQMQELIDRILEMDWHKDCSSEKEAVLTLKVKGKQNLKITDGQVILSIGIALSEYVKTIEDGSKLASAALDLDSILNSRVTIDKTPMFALFTKMMKSFLEPYKAKPPYPKSLDKMLLISRMIYILGLSDDKRYYDEYETDEDGKIIIDRENGFKKKNFLKNIIRRYENYKYTTVGNVYMC